MVRMRPWQLALVVVTCAAAALVAVRATAVQLAGDGPERTVVVTMHHSRFEPATIRVEAGRRVRFVLRNTDPIDHEFILGDDAVQRRHEQAANATTTARSPANARSRPARRPPPPTPSRPAWTAGSWSSPATSPATTPTACTASSGSAETRGRGPVSGG